MALTAVLASSRRARASQIHEKIGVLFRKGNATLSAPSESCSLEKSARGHAAGRIPEDTARTAGRDGLPGFFHLEIVLHAGRHILTG